MRKIAALLLTISFAISCKHKSLQDQNMMRDITYAPTTRLIDPLPSAFEPLTAGELDQTWGEELYCGTGFAREMDLYRSITCYKRAMMLAKAASVHRSRLEEIEFDIILSYYLSAHYNEAIEFFEGSSLIELSENRPFLLSLYPILYDSYLRRGETKKAIALETLIKEKSQDMATRLACYRTLLLAEIDRFPPMPHESQLATSMRSFRDDFELKRKSPRQAEVLNALLPGSGYFYVEQYQSGITSFLLNAVFTIAAWQFFQKGYTAAGIITAGFEVGWYVGGIRGAGLAADDYNRRLYTQTAKKTMEEERLFPIFMVNYAF